MKRNAINQRVHVFMIDASDGLTPITAGVTVGGVTIDGVDGAAAGTLTHVGRGKWQYVLAQAETDCVHVSIDFSGGGAIPDMVQAYPLPYGTGDRLGVDVLSMAGDDAQAANLDAAVSSRSSHAPSAIVSGGAINTSAGAVSAVTATTSVTNPVTAGTVTDKTGYDVTSIDGNTSAATKLAASADGLIPGVATSGTLSTTQMTTDLTSYLAGELVGRLLTFTGGVADGQNGKVTANTAGGLLTFEDMDGNPFTTAPVAGDSFTLS